jgi:hypothetical protein
MLLLSGPLQECASSSLTRANSVTSFDLDGSSGTVYPHSSDSEDDPVISSKPRKKRSISSGDEGCGSPVLKPESKKKRIVKTDDDRTPLPDPFLLPKHFAQDVEVALKRKKLSSSEKNKIYFGSCICDA